MKNIFTTVYFEEPVTDLEDVVKDIKHYYNIEVAIVGIEAINVYCDGKKFGEVLDFLKHEGKSVYGLDIKEIGYSSDTLLESI